VDDDVQFRAELTPKCTSVVVNHEKRHTSPNAGRTRHMRQLTAFSTTFTDVKALITVIFP